MNNKVYNDFLNRVDAFVNKMLSDYKPCDYNKNKVIHDPVWGTMVFYPWELQILDSPLLQRLRRINQVGLVVLTYPSSHHTRFEHSLGVMSVVTMMVNHINQGNILNNKNIKDKKIISDEDLFKLRFAALMHDAGHCFFSHLSELYYEKYEEFARLKKECKIFRKAKGHEILSYLIVNCDSFKKFVKTKTTYPLKIDNNFFTDIGAMIIGTDIAIKKENKEYINKKYLVQMINGQFDADKLDYLRRDSYTAGLALTYDIERFLYKIKLYKLKEKHKNRDITTIDLTIPISGVSAIEEMVFCQLMLISYIYQHQKVLATDALIEDVVQGLYKYRKLVHPCDFLYYCDDDIFKMYDDTFDSDFVVPISKKKINDVVNKKISDIVKQIRTRDLPNIAFIIGNTTISEEDIKEHKIIDIADDIKKLSELRQEICDESNLIIRKMKLKRRYRKIDIYDIHISVPKTSLIKDFSGAYVLANDNNPIKLSDIISFKDWADSFLFHRWNAYVFSRHDIIDVVSIASRNVFERHGILFNDNKVFKVLKNEKCIKKLYLMLKHK